MCSKPRDLTTRADRDRPDAGPFEVENRALLDFCAQGSAALLLSLCAAFASSAHAADPDRLVRTVAFPPGATATAAKGHVQGRRYADYLVRAGAGQTLRVAMHTPHGALQFNVIAPGGGSVAMFAEGAPERPFEAVLPIAGTYAVRVYLVRAAARRNEFATFALDVALEGAALRPLRGREDALIRATRYHASADVPCQPAYSAARRCEASVIRYDHAGTASVVLRWPQGRRTVLFRERVAVASDAAQPMTAEPRPEATLLRFGDGAAGGERFEVPEALLTGG